MLCDECKKNLANVHMTKIINDKMSKIHLCEECAKELTPDPVDFVDIFASLPQMLASVLSSIELVDDPSITEAPDRCEKCGSSFNDLRETGILGCPDCYSAFEPRLKSVLKRIHGNTEHRGRIPKNIDKEIKTKITLRNLKEELHQLVDKESFEEAAVVRDKIKELESTLVSHG